MADKTFKYFFDGRWYESVDGVLKAVPEGDIRGEVDEERNAAESQCSC